MYEDELCGGIIIERVEVINEGLCWDVRGKLAVKVRVGRKSLDGGVPT